MKTGFTCAAGYNLVASAVRDGRRLIAVVLGETSRWERAEEVAQLMNKGFAQQAWEGTKSLDGIEPGQTGESDPPAQGVIAESCASIVAVAGAPGVSSGRAATWSVELGGAFRNRALANAAGSRLLAREASLKGGKLSVLQGRGAALHFRPVVMGLGEKAAQAGCLKLRRDGVQCKVLSPAHLTAAVDRAVMASRSARNAWKSSAAKSNVTKSNVTKTAVRQVPLKTVHKVAEKTSAKAKRPG